MWSVWTLWTLLQEGATLCWAIWKCGLHRVTVVRRPGVYRPRCQQRDVKEFSFTILHARLQVVNRLLILLQPGWLEFNVLAEVTLALYPSNVVRVSCCWDQLLLILSKLNLSILKRAPSWNHLCLLVLFLLVPAPKPDDLCGSCNFTLHNQTQNEQSFHLSPILRLDLKMFPLWNVLMLHPSNNQFWTLNHSFGHQRKQVAINVLKYILS